MADPLWQWFDATYEALARGQVDLSAGGEAALSAVDPQDSDREVALLDSPAAIPLPGARVVRVGPDTGWVFGDLQWGPEVSAENVRSVVVSAAGRQVAYLPLGRAVDVVNGVLSVAVDGTAVLMLGNRRG
jgi:hypothetical protein